MNQILSVENTKNKKKKQHKTEIHSVIVVFAVILLIFGIGLTCSGAYSCYKNVSNNVDNVKATSASSKPIITTEREDATTINIVVTHDKAIASVTYQINDEDLVEIDGKNKTEVKQEVELPSGNSTIKITAKDVNGISSSYETSQETEDKPTITLEQVDGKIKTTVTSNENIDFIMYYWDENEQDAKKFTVNDVKTETLIDVEEGIHTLNLVAQDINGVKSTKTQKVIGDNKPELDVQTDGKTFTITGSDDEELSKIEITLNSDETKTEEINQKTYKGSVDLVDGENKLIVTIYNKNGLSKTAKVRYVKE